MYKDSGNAKSFLPRSRFVAGGQKDEPTLGKDLKLLLYWFGFIYINRGFGDDRPLGGATFESLGVARFGHRGARPFVYSSTN